VLVEGAGSAAEVNLRAGDIANMGFARPAGVPVVLVGDIDRGGVIASIAGTHLILEQGDRAAVRGFVINKFRGEPALFKDGLAFIEGATGWRGYGVVPWLAATRSLPSEDSMGLERPPARNGTHGRVVVACPLLPRIANFDDLDPLAAEPGVELVMVRPGQPIPSEAALIILPGSKATLADLATLRREGWDIDIRAHVRRGGRVLGLCGGYQMLGRTIADPHGIEGSAGSAEGLGLLDVETVLTPHKRLQEVTGVLHPSGATFAGYEMHVGETAGPDTARAPLWIGGAVADGARSADGLVTGTYVHGWLGTASARSVLLGELGADTDGRNHAATVDAALNEIASELERCMDIDALIALAREAT
jgi:adenosylcobyric acid synthase